MIDIKGLLRKQICISKRDIINVHVSGIKTDIYGQVKDISKGYFFLI
jgi:hypothetical protein